MERKIFKIIDKIINITSVVFLSLMLIFVVLQIIMRYVFNAPLVWSEELARYCMFFMIFIGCMIAMKDNDHLKVDIVINALPKRAKAVVNIINKLISFVFLVILIWFGFKFAFNNINIRSSIVTQIRMGLVYMIIPLCSIGMLIYLIIPHKEEK